MSRVSLINQAWDKIIFHRATRAWMRDARATWRNLPYKISGAPDGLPTPPARLIHLVAGTPDIHWFLHAGEMGAVNIRDILERSGLNVDQ